ncbi:MAG: tRNA uridine-5-carboxymethylaminomethyl(34) synthesis GTPase MnmE [Helicobacteraceae bacterium]|jgi:tRNA modification GTPase|nr:tRNA uridine-5-carboxymethylaminomethyl(34) synthesis GTPase MnmE [Helicobacteraceae bacterium]
MRGESDTIAALATAVSQGAIAIVRLSGGKSLPIALLVTRRASLVPRQATLTYLFNDSGEPFDQAIVIFFESPKSYTGEDIVEFQTHGGTLVASMLLDRLIALGARAARAGEFTLRAVLNSKYDLTQAEAVLALTTAKSKRAAALLTRRLKGEMSRFVEELRSELLALLAYCEASIDYAEDLPPQSARAMEERLGRILALLRGTIASSNRRKGLIEGFEAAIIGKPNSGKSSLLNALLGQNRAIVSPNAGTTRDLIAEEALIGGVNLRLIDTAGLRESGDEIERIGVSYAIGAFKDADLIIAVFDGSSVMDENDRITLDLIGGAKERTIIAINKNDLPLLIDIDEFGQFETVSISAKNDIAPLLRALETRLSLEAASEEPLLVSARERAFAAQALSSCQIADDRLKAGELELFAIHINEALLEIGSLTRRAEYGELLDTMFSEFCLGK